MRLLLALVLLLLCTAACPRGADQSVQRVQTPFAASGSLRYRDHQLSYIGPQGREQALVYSPAADAGPIQPMPYKLVYSATPRIVSTIDERLEPCCWALPADEAKSPVAYPGCVPLFCSGHVCALQDLASDSLSLGGINLLGPEGGLLRDFRPGELLSPSAGKAGDVAYIAVPGTEASSFYPFGERPGVIAFGTAVQKTLWTAELPSTYACADLRLVALTERRALLAVQYDYEMYEFFSVDQAGKVGAAGKLSQQPSFTTSLPGGSFDFSAVQVEGETVRVLLAAGRQWFSLDLDSGASEVLPAAEQQADLLEANPLPVGGSAIPGPGAVPLSQGLLPTEHGDSWEIPAVLRGDGAVLVLGRAASGRSEARWLLPVAD